MNKTTSFLYILIAFLIGIAVQETYLFGWADYWPIIILAGIFGMISNSYKWHKSAFILFIICFFLLGMTRSISTQHHQSKNSIDYYASEEKNNTTIVGDIIEEPDIRRDKVNYTVLVSNLLMTSSEKSLLAGRHGNVQNSPPTDRQANAKENMPNNPENSENLKSVSGKILISTGKYPSYNYGDTLKISGYLQKPTQFDTFDYAGYLSRYDIYSVMYRPFVKLIKSYKIPKLQEPISYIWSFKDLKDDFFSILLKAKKTFENQLNKTFSTEPSSSFMAGLLTGSRKGIPEDLSEAFRITGLTHIIAISGYNITLIVMIFMSIFRPLGKKLSIIISTIGIILFTLFVGASAAVVRACIMGLIGLLAINSNRKNQITTTLFLTAAIMIGYNPKILFYDIGFQLSFLATMGLIYVSPLIESYFLWLPKKLAIRESILMTISAQIMALPIIVMNFQSLSIVSPLSNLLIAGPVIPLSMLFGFLGTMLSFIFIPLAKIIAYPAYLLLGYISLITKLTAKIPYGNIEISWFQTPILIIYFIILTFILLRKWETIHKIDDNIRLIQLELNQNIIHRLYVQNE